MQYNDAHQETKHQDECLAALSQYLQVGLEAHGGEEGEHEDILQCAVEGEFDVENLVEDECGDGEDESSRYRRWNTKLL